MKPNKFIKSRPAIYGIRNLINGKLYIGKTHCMYRRCSQYLYDYSTRSLGHLNNYLFSAMKKVGIDNFNMFVLEFCEPENLVECELKWIMEFNTTDRNKGYNLRMDSSSGMIAHAETRLKISQNLKRQWADGVRSTHSEKLKKSWMNASELRVKEQSELFRKCKTKYTYIIEHPNGQKEVCTYMRLKGLGLQGAVGNMSRSGKNITKCYDKFIVNRYPVGEAPSCL